MHLGHGRYGFTTVVYNYSIGSIINSAMSVMCNEVLKLQDISEAETHKLHELFELLHQSVDLLVPTAVTASDDEFLVLFVALPCHKPLLYSVHWPLKLT